ncbi:MAG: hypothetical protein ABI806_12730 [Candidatus Solibacter sp.]
MPGTPPRNAPKLAPVEPAASDPLLTKYEFPFSMTDASASSNPAAAGTCVRNKTSVAGLPAGKTV